MSENAEEGRRCVQSSGYSLPPPSVKKHFLIHIRKTVSSLPGPFLNVLQHAERDVTVGFAQLCSTSASGLRDNMVCSIQLHLLCGGRSWHSSLTNSNSQQSESSGNTMSNSKLISAIVITERASGRSCFRLWGVFLRCLILV